MLDRILTAFNKNFPTEERSEMWNWVHSHSGQVELTEANLNNMGQNNLCFGFFTGTAAGDTNTAIIDLAKALGVCGLQNPENGYQLFPRTNINGLTTSQVLDRIQEALPFEISLPKFIGGRDAITTKYGFITERHVHYLWVMKRIIELCPDRNSRIIEIGAGLGILGYYLDRAGYKDYTIIDLALTNVCQAWFLKRNLPGREFILSGDGSEVVYDFEEAFKINHASDFDWISRAKFDLMINIDGLTEMNIEAAKKYANSDCAKMFLSINHEVNEFRVCEIVSEKKRLYRYPFWLRAGYVEECYSK